MQPDGVCRSEEGCKDVSGFDHNSKEGKRAMVLKRGARNKAVAVAAASQPCALGIQSRQHDAVDLEYQRPRDNNP